MSQADRRDEFEAERDDRNMAELLQELRVAGLGVQVLFGFLLSLPFTSRFATLSQAQRQLYVASLMLAACPRPCCLGQSPTIAWCSGAGRRNTSSGRPTSWRSAA
jgi:hypothetical protein